MKGKQKPIISALLVALLLSNQLSTAVWAESRRQLDDILSGEEENKKESGYATPNNADRAEEETSGPDDALFKPDNEPKDGETPSQGNKPEEEGSEKTILRWEFLDDDNLSGGQLSLIGVNWESRADFDTVVSMLPTRIKVEIADGTEPTVLSITGWSCPEYEQDGEGQWPYAGEYEFTAGLSEGYVCEPPISVTVILGGAQVYTINDRFAADGLSYKELGPDTVQLMGYDGEKPEGSLNIPDRVIKPSNGREYKVVRIGENAFKDCTGLTGDLVISNTVTEIGDMAFYKCNFTGELTLSDSLIKIGDIVFCESGFTGQLKLPDTLTYIGDTAFFSTGFSGQLKFPEELTYIGSSAFSNCKFTGDLLIPDTVTHIGQLAFQDTEFGGKLTLSKGLTQIEREVFANCKFTGELNIPDTVTSIGLYAFGDCGFTGQLVLPDGLTELNVRAFYDCSGLTGRVKLPDGLSAIGSDVFTGTTIEGYDTAKQSVADLLYHSGVPEGKIAVGAQPFQPSADKTFQHGNMKYERIGSNAVKLISYSGNPDEDLFIPDTVTAPDGHTYSVTYIGERAFSNKHITGSLRLPEMLVGIENWAFSQNEFTGRLTLPNTLTYIDFCAFQSCSFTGDLTIPDNVSYIGSNAFSQGGFTGDLIIKGRLSDLEPNIFYGCGFTGALSFPDTLTSIGANAFSGCGFTGNLALPAGLKVIGNAAFMDCVNLTGVLSLPETVTEIGYLAFYGCDSLDSAHLGPNLQKLGRQAFPVSLPLSTDSPKVQLLINTYLNQDAIANTSWNGKEDVPDGAVASVKQNAVVTGDKRIGEEAVITVPDGIVLTVDGSLKVDGMMFVEGTLVISGSLSGSGAILVGRNGKAEGKLSGFRIEYQKDRDALLEAKKLIESHTYTAKLENGESEEAVKDWLLNTIAAIPGFGRTGATVVEVKLTAFTPATEGTSDIPNGLDGGFAFTLLLTKGYSEDSAGGAGTITAREYSHIPNHRSSGRDRESTAINTDILRGTWVRTENGIWKFRQTNGIYAAGRWGIVDNLWYYFDGEGRLLTGWQLIKNQWYCLCTEEDTKTKTGLKEGAMVTGWHYDPAYQRWFYLNADGAMAMGWKEIDGKLYYFNPESDGTRGALQKEEPL